jgi:hypothetical protein
MSPMRSAGGDAQCRLMQRDELTLNDLVLRLKRLVQERDVLEWSGASEAEIEARTAEIDRVRSRLARRAKEAADGYDSAA